MRKFTRRSFIRTAGAATSLGLLNGNISHGEQKRRPNILYIMSDDHAANAISCYGSRLAEAAPTPNIDRLASEGMRLTRCFCTNSICVPSRASIITGTYSHINGVYTLADSIDPERENVAKILGRNGYKTAIIGKWHLHTDPSGFDYWNVLPGQGRYHNPVLREIGAENPRIYEGHSTDVIAGLAIDWMKDRDKDAPFFLMCHFKAPHEPWDYARRYKEYLEDVEIPEPESLWEDKSHRSEGSREYGFTIETMAERQTKEKYHSDPPQDWSGMSETEIKKKAYQVFLKRYLRTIRGVDDNVGRILDFLDDSGLTENTVVIYSSDQGYFLGEHNYIDKRWMFEESLQMPFIVRYPGEIEAGSVNGDIAINVDFAPTFLDYAGVETPRSMQGRSMRPLFRGKTPDNWRDAMYYRYWMHTNRPAHYGLRTARYKLIYFYGLPLGMTGTRKEATKVGWELYDLEKDPKELLNVYDDPSYRNVVKELKKRLTEEKERLGDSDDKYPKLAALNKKTGRRRKTKSYLQTIITGRGVHSRSVILLMC